MKCIIVVILLTTFSSRADVSLNDLLNGFVQVVFLDHSFKPYLDNIRPMLKTGNDTLDIPLIDPYKLDYKKINISNELLTADGNLTKVEVHGLSNYTVNSATYNAPMLKVKSNLTWPSIVMNSSYDLDATFMKVMNLSIYGDGNLTLELSNLTLDMTAWLGLKDGKVFVKSVATNVTLDSNLFYANGIYNNDFSSVVISDVITSWLPYVIENYPWVIVDPFNAKTVDVINERYQNATLQDVINVIDVSAS